MTVVLVWSTAAPLRLLTPSLDPHRTTAARQSSHDSKTCLGTDLPVTVASQDHPESKESTPTLLEGHPLS